MRSMAAPVVTNLGDEALLDTCGTGGDGTSTFNISTVAAFVAAGAGVRVAKHGNRSISSQCGSADLLEALGVRLAIPPAESARAIREVGIGFLYAPAIHPAMRHAQPVRVDLRMRTVFNLLGPLTNPAGATAQVVGAPSGRAAELMAGALAALGLARGLVVHGCDGLDEITTTGPTLAFEVREGRVTRRVLEPADFGVPAAAGRGSARRRQRAQLRNRAGDSGRSRRTAARYCAGECRRGVGGVRPRARLSRGHGRGRRSHRQRLRAPQGRRTGALYGIPECRLRIWGRFWEKAERAITISKPASSACCLSSPCTWDR